MFNFSLAQTFYLDPALFQNAYEISISKVNLYFKNKPVIDFNKSGLLAPGVNITIVPTANGKPILSSPIPIQIARKEYNQIIIDSTAQSPTIFKFTNPVVVNANMTWAIIVGYDGNEDFQVWTDKKGDFLLDANGNITTTISPGPSGKYIGSLFSFISTFPLSNTSLPNANVSSDPFVPSVSNQAFPSQIPPFLNYTDGSWFPIDDTDLKFQVEVARYSHNGFCVSSNGTITSNNLVDIVLSNNIIVLANNAVRMVAPAYPMEYIYYDLKTSQTSNIHYGDWVYQYQPYFPGGTATPATVSVQDGNVVVSVNTAYLLANGANVSFSQLYGFDRFTKEYIIVTSLNHFGANQHAVEVRLVTQSVNGQILVDQPFTFNNSAAYFYKSPVGRIYSKTRPMVSGFTRDLLVLSDSNANGSCRFVNNCIMSSNIIAGGSGFANSDYIIVSGFETVTNEVLGGYSAFANIVTYANGNIRFIYFSNVGSGFVNSSLITYRIANSTGNNSTGTGANLSFGVDTLLYDRFGNQNTFFKGCTITNFDAQALIPHVGINNPLGTIYSIKYQSLYFSQSSANTFSGRHYLIDPINAVPPINVINDQPYEFSVTSQPCIVSRSNQFVIGYANGFIPNTSIIGDRFSNTAVFFIDMYSNNDFTMVSFTNTEILSFYSKYNINNDYSKENTNYGNCFAKHVSTKVTLANGQFSEDMLVYLTAIRPPGTDIKVLARLHNSHDGDAFDDKDWTLFEQIDGIGVFTSLTNPNDRCELTYGLRLYPNSGIATNTSTTAAVLTLPGAVTTQLNNNAIVGVNTSFSSNLVSGNLIRIYQPLFTNADYVVAVVNTVTNSTYITINDPITNNSVVGSGLKIDLISYPLQAFKNLTSDNVVRYFTSTGVAFDTFDTFQFKVLMLSGNSNIVPKVDDIRAVAVTS